MHIRYLYNNVLEIQTKKKNNNKKIDEYIILYYTPNIISCTLHPSSYIIISVYYNLYLMNTLLAYITEFILQCMSKDGKYM